MVRLKRSISMVKRLNPGLDPGDQPGSSVKALYLAEYNPYLILLQVAMKVFGLAGYSGSGKTTLLEKLIPAFSGLGITVSVIKHAHHDFDIDRPGKDSYRQRQAGASEVLVSSAQRWAVMHELRGAPEPGLAQHLARLSPCDLVLVEGFKREPIPKLEIYRAGNAKPLLFPQDHYIIALATDAQVETHLPCFDLNDALSLAQFILKETELR